MPLAQRFAGKYGRCQTAFVDGDPEFLLQFATQRILVTS